MFTRSSLLQSILIHPVMVSEEQAPGKIAGWDPEEMKWMLKAFVEKTGFDGIPPSPKEAALPVSIAGQLPRW